MVVVIGGCGSGGSTGPGEPVAPSELTFSYGRVVNVDGQMHAQWSCSLPTRGDIRYGRAAYTQLTSAPETADSQDVELTNLSYNTGYLYQIIARDSLGRSVQCDGQFTTPPKASPEPVISDFTIENITESAARVTWRTDEPAIGILYYGIGSPSDSLAATSLSEEHAFDLTPLDPSTTYHLRAEAVNAANLRGVGPDTSFATARQLTVSFPDTVLTMGDTLQLPLFIHDAENLAALRIGIEFETGMVEVVAVEEGPFFTDRRGFIFFDDIHNSSGYFLVNLSWNIDYEGNRQVNTDADGSGIVAYARLRGLEAGQAELRFDPDSTFGLDMFGNVRSCRLTAGSVEIEP